VSERYAEQIAALGAPLLDLLYGLERSARHLAPGRLPALREHVAPFRFALDRALTEFRGVEPPEPMAALHEGLVEAAELAARAAELLVDSSDDTDTLPRLMASMRTHTLAVESLYPLHPVLPPVARFFAEPALHPTIAALDPESPGDRVGLFRTAGPDGVDGRGGFYAYVPERYDGSTPRPLIVALHGGSGDGRSFLWTWLREARSRECLLVAPTSRGPTWSFNGEDVDAAALHAILGWVREQWSVDPDRVLLTGLSDGATYTLFCGLREDSPFRALAPLSGVLHPSVLVSGGLDHVRGRRIYLVHGALDWMFPVELARITRDALEKAGAELVYRELEDLSHSYAREENAKILDWLGAPLDLPAAVD
jgi:phospholipase/carboxylesterase